MHFKNYLNDSFEEEYIKYQNYLNDNNSVCEFDFLKEHDFLDCPLPKSEDINNLIINTKNIYNKEDLKTSPKLKEEIPQIDINNKKNLLIPKNENLSTEKNKSTSLGIKTKNTNLKVYDKYSPNNIIRKIKISLISSLTNFINNIIYLVYKGKIGQGFLQKELKSPESYEKNVQENKELLDKQLKDIFSVPISKRYSNYFSNHNQKLISYLLNEEDIKIKIKFEKIFNLTFLECLNHFVGKEYIKELEGIKTFNEIFKKYENEPEYLKMVQEYANDYKDILCRKKSRNRKKEKTNNQ